jgi:hypothetical protein
MTPARDTKLPASMIVVIPKVECFDDPWTGSCLKREICRHYKFVFPPGIRAAALAAFEGQHAPKETE